MSLKQIINHSNRYSQFTKYFLQYYNLMSSVARSTFVGRANSATTPGLSRNANTTQVFLSGVSQVKQVKLSHADFEAIRAQLAKGAKSISLDTVKEAHNDAYASSLRSKKDMWRHFLEFNIKAPQEVEQGGASAPAIEMVRPLPRDAAVIEYYTKHAELFDPEDHDSIVEYLTSEKEWNRQAIRKSTPEQMQVFKMQDYANAFNGVDRNRRVAAHKLISASTRWNQWKNRKGIVTEKFLIPVNHESLHQFQAFPIMYKPRQIQGRKGQNQRIIQQKRRKWAMSDKQKAAKQAARMEKRRVEAEAHEQVQVQLE